MKPTTRTRLILGGLVAVHVVLHFSAWFVDPSLSKFGQALHVDAVPQGILLGFWVAMGGRKMLPWRACLAIALPFAVIHGNVWCLEPNLRGWAQWEANYLFVPMFLIIVTLLVARVLGLRHVPAAAQRVLDTPIQFSLLEIFSWLTACGIILGIVKCVPDQLMFTYVPRVQHACFTFLALVLIWLLLEGRGLFLRSCLCALVVGLTSIVVAWAVDWELLWGYLFVFCVYSVWLIPSLLVIRWAGYRLEWQWRFGRKHRNQATLGYGGISERKQGMDTGGKPHRLRWYQFRLRSLFILMILASIGMSWIGIKLQDARRQREIVEEIEKLGGVVSYDYQLAEPYSDVPPGPQWLQTVLGNDCFATVVFVSLCNTGVTDDRLGPHKGAFTTPDLVA